MFLLVSLLQGVLPGGSVVKNPHANAGDMGSSPGRERSPGEGNGNTLQYSFFFFFWKEIISYFNAEF